MALITSTPGRILLPVYEAPLPPHGVHIPEHFDGWKYSGPDKPYAVHYWGTTRGTYEQGT